MSQKKDRMNEQAQHVRVIKASKRPRGRHSGEWEKLKKEKRRGRESRDDGVYRKQASLSVTEPNLNLPRLNPLIEECSCLPECYPFRSKEMGGPVHESACECALGDRHEQPSDA